MAIRKSAWGCGYCGSDPSSRSYGGRMGSCWGLRGSFWGLGSASTSSATGVSCEITRKRWGGFR